MPTLEIGELVRHRKLRRLHEIHGDQAGNVGDREGIAGDKRAMLQLRIEQADEFLDARLVGLGPGGDLWHLHLLHSRMRVAENV